MYVSVSIIDYMDAYMDASDFARETLSNGVGAGCSLIQPSVQSLALLAPDEIR
jgi:hypothetical protein